MKNNLSVADQLKKKYHKTEEVTNFKDMLYRSGDIYRSRTAFKVKDENGTIKSVSEEKNSENTLKKVWINNLRYNTKPKVGEVNLFYKNINNFAKSDLVETNQINDSLDFEITSESESNLDNPILYNNLANPIVVSYINSNIKSDYTMTDTSIPITYDGSLLKRCNVPLDSLNCSFTFDIYIINNLDQEFKCTAFINIPLEDNEKSIYDGNVIQKINTNLNFYRYK